MSNFCGAAPMGKHRPTCYRSCAMPKTRSKNGLKGRSKARKPSGRASKRELAAMRAYLKATGEPVPAERIQAIRDELAAAAKAPATRR